MKKWLNGLFWNIFSKFYSVRASYIDEKLAEDIKKSSTKVSDHGLSGYRVDSPITDWNEVEKQLDKAKKIVNNESSLNEKDRVFRDCLLVLMRSIDVKTRKVDELIARLEDMSHD